MNEQTKYDADATQIVSVDIYEDEQKFTVEHVFAAHSDEDFFKIDEGQQFVLQSDAMGQNTQITNRAGAEKRLEFWAKFCQRVSGYGAPEESLPDDWHELVPDEDKLVAVDGVFKGQILRDAKSEARQYLAWNRNASTKYRVESLFNGEVVETAVELKSKSASDVARWNEISNSISLKNGRLMESNAEMQLPATAREKVKLIQELVTASDNYAGRIPAHHLLIVANDYFAPKAAAAKKSNSSPSASASA